jgi:pilus assembly protein Flp/PilA
MATNASPSKALKALRRAIGTRLASYRSIELQWNEDVMKKMLKQFIADESGATAIEYGLIAAGIAIAIVPALNGVGSSLKVKFTTISTSLK